MAAFTTKSGEKSKLTMVSAGVSISRPSSGIKGRSVVMEGECVEAALGYL